MESIRPMDFVKIGIIVVLLIILFRATRDHTPSADNYTYVDPSGRQLSWWQMKGMYPPYMQNSNAPTSPYNPAAQPQNPALDPNRMPAR
jgi:hypothetical protein